jgi:iron-sulfur cluster assembly accessory protein
MLTISNSANERIKQIKETNPSNLLRIAIDSGGCNGFKYLFSIDSNVKEEDKIINEGNEAMIVVDTISLKFLENSTLEFVKELGATYFKISNPNATSTCGCGSSFAT